VAINSTPKGKYKNGVDAAIHKKVQQLVTLLTGENSELDDVIYAFDKILWVLQRPPVKKAVKKMPREALTQTPAALAEQRQYGTFNSLSGTSGGMLFDPHAGNTN